MKVRTAWFCDSGRGFESLTPEVLQEELDRLPYKEQPQVWLELRAKMRAESLPLRAALPTAEASMQVDRVELAKVKVDMDIPLFCYLISLIDKCGSEDWYGTTKQPARCESGAHLKPTKKDKRIQAKLQRVLLYLQEAEAQSAVTFLEGFIVKNFCSCVKEMQTGELETDTVTAGETPMTQDHVCLEKSLCTRESFQGLRSIIPHPTCAFQRPNKAPYTGLIISPPNAQTAKRVLALKATENKSIIVGKNREHPFPLVQPKPDSKAVLAHWQKMRRNGMAEAVRVIEQDYISNLPLELWLQEMHKLTHKATQFDAEEKTAKRIMQKETEKFLVTFRSYDSSLLSSKPVPFESVGEPRVYSPAWRADRFSVGVKSGEFELVPMLDSEGNPIQNKQGRDTWLYPEEEDEPLFAVDRRITNHFVLREVIEENLETYRTLQQLQWTRTYTPVPDEHWYGAPLAPSAYPPPEEPKKTVLRFIRVDLQGNDNDPLCTIDSLYYGSRYDKANMVWMYMQSVRAAGYLLPPMKNLSQSEWGVWGGLHPQPEKGVWGWLLDYQPLYFAAPPAPAPLPREEQEAYGQAFLDAPGEVTIWESGESIRIAKRQTKSAPCLYLAPAQSQYFSSKEEALEYCRAQAKEAFRIRLRTVNGKKRRQRDFEGWVKWNVRHCALSCSMPNAVKPHGNIKEVHEYKEVFHGGVVMIYHAPNMCYKHPLIGWSDAFTGNSKDVYDKRERIAFELAEEVLHNTEEPTEDAEPENNEGVELAMQILDVWDNPEED